MITYTVMYTLTAAQTPKVFLPHETEQFVCLFRYGLVALDMYRVTTLPNGSYSRRVQRKSIFSVVATTFELVHVYLDKSARQL